MSEEGFVCQKCSKVFTQKHNLEYHLTKTKIKCDDKIYKDAKFQCKYCPNIYVKNSTLKAHIEKIHKLECKTVKITGLKENKKLKEENIKLKEENIKLKEKALKHEKKAIKKMKVAKTKKMKNINIYNFNNNLNVSANLVIGVKSFGQPDYQNMPDYIWKQCKSDPFKGIPLLFKDIYFNIDTPQNHSIVKINIKKRLYEIVNGTNRYYIKEHKLISKVIYFLIDLIERTMAKNEDTLTQKEIDKLDKILDIIDELCKEITSNSYKNPKIKPFLEEMRSILRNSAEIINLIKQSGYTYQSDPNNQYEHMDDLTKITPSHPLLLKQFEDSDDEDSDDEDSDDNDDDNDDNDDDNDDKDIDELNGVD